MSDAELLKRARSWMFEVAIPAERIHMEAEGGCGVVGLASNIPLPGRHILEPLRQMHNRGNGKGGGIAAVGLSPVQMKVSSEILKDDYLIQVAYLDPSVRETLESEFIRDRYDVHASYKVDNTDDPEVLACLPVKPPEVVRYFCRARRDKLAEFVSARNLSSLASDRAEDEFVYQTSFAINLKYYASSKMTAFVMSHGRDMIVMKIVGYAEDVIRYYKLEDLTAHVWIGHQRYPTKGRVWHPGGAHPFMGLDEALVHNGDFANYHSVCEYLAQRNIRPLFLTDTEVSVLLFDVLNRTYGYPLEYIIEALAPTGERDFEQLPEEKKPVYRAIQRTHVHGSPDGPWFFIIGRNRHYDGSYELIGITDTSMLRPQVFALVEGKVQIGLVASEKQAIDSALRSISSENPSVPKQADMYWNARGGSYTDGGAFVFTVRGESGGRRLSCTNKFGTPVMFSNSYSEADDLSLVPPIEPSTFAGAEGSAEEVFARYLDLLRTGTASEIRGLFSAVAARGLADATSRKEMLRFLTLSIDRRYDSGRFRRSRLLEKATECINLTLRSTPRIGSEEVSGQALVDVSTKELSPPPSSGCGMVIDARGFPMEGDDTVSSVIRRAHGLGWHEFTVIDAHGQRFFGCGLGPGSTGTKIEIYGTPGDYLASGLAGAEIVVHGNAQDQLGQILGSGKLVVHGDVGQTFMYGAKGGEVYVLGNAAGRPLINAVGKPRVVINGTCLDYLAESFMAGDPHNGGGFVVLNGIALDSSGKIVELKEPYPGGNLFSLASGGAIFIRDPKRKVGEDQLNGGHIAELSEKDWQLILPYLNENEKLFGIEVEDLLTVDGTRRQPIEVYRKVEAVHLSTLTNSNGGH
ncbi:MAG: hypothetical protein LUO79_08005 [Methanomassiliicoccales archaeon]|nr:hypothetical protein [Methanomassiliicoccales archaeon]